MSFIQGLNKLYTNYERMIIMEEETLKSTKKACNEIDKIKENFVQEFISLVERKKEYADYIDNSLENQKVISSQIKNTDWLIQSKLLLEQKKNERIAAEEHAQKQMIEKIQEGRKRKEKLNTELERLMEEYAKVEKVLAAEGTSLDKFEESPSFKRLIDDLDRQKDLEQAIFENKITVSDLQARIRILQSQKEVATCLSRHLNWLPCRRAGVCILKISQRAKKEQL